MRIEDVKVGMRLIETRGNSFKTPLTVTSLINNGFRYKYDQDVHLGARIGYISKDSECEAYSQGGQVMYAPLEEETWGA